MDKIKVTDIHSDPTHEDSTDSFINPDLIKPLKKNLVKTDNINKTVVSSGKHDTKENLKNHKAPAQRLAEISVAIPYKEPSWGGILPDQYSFEVIKNGVVFETLQLLKSHIVIGRFSTCDVVLEHPSISRFHCIIQQRKEGDEQAPGIYAYDLGSTHGTYQNKHKLKPRMYNRLHVGHILKFGGSTRLFILQGPDTDQEPETKETVSQLIALAEERKKNVIKVESDLQKNVKKSSDIKGIDWGMGDDAQDDSDDDEEFTAIKNPFVTNEELYLDDPKKSLNGWFEREGYDLPSYDVREIKPGVFKASVEIPFPSFGEGQPIICSVEHRGKKKDTIIQCALEACRTLDKQGLLRKSVHASHERKRKNWTENDYYDSDEDEFLDRTGDIERKRKLRKKEIESAKSKLVGVETYDSLIRQYNDIIKELDSLEKKLKEVDLRKKQMSLQGGKNILPEGDDLESYMSNLNSQLPDKHKRVAWKLEFVKLQKQELKLRKFVNMARPMGTQELPPRVTDNNCGEVGEKQKTNSLGSKSKSRIQIHEVFLEKEEEEKIKLPKVNCEDDSEDIKPVPYSKPQKSVDKYQELLLLRKRLNKKLGITEENNKESESPKLSLNLKSSKSGTETEDLKCNMLSSSKLLPADMSNEISDILSSKKYVQNHKTTDAESLNTPINLSENLEQLLKEEVLDELEFIKPSFSLKSKIKQKETKKTKSKNCFDFEKDYESWVPPTGQTGDGRTHLNEKLGY